jgi:hypothetical protein
VAVAPANQGGGDGEDSGAGDVPLPMLAVCMLPWMGRERRRETRR